MIQSIRSELRKLLTVRSTYVIIALCLAVVIFFAFYLEGYRQTANVRDPGLLAREITSAANALGIFIAIAGILLMTHEYRYNTIMYTLTASRGRTQTLLAKIIVISLFAVALTLLVCTLAPLLTYLGIQAKGLDIVPQNIPYADVYWRVAFYGWAYSMIALLISALIRNQVGAFAVFLLFPIMAESLLTLLLREKAIYLPFTAMNTVLSTFSQSPGSSTLTPERAALVTLGYLVVGWAIAWFLFLRRDAS